MSNVERRTLWLAYVERWSHREIAGEWLRADAEIVAMVAVMWARLSESAAQQMPYLTIASAVTGLSVTVLVTLGLFVWRRPSARVQRLLKAVR